MLSSTPVMHFSTPVVHFSTPVLLSSTPVALRGQDSGGPGLDLLDLLAVHGPPPALNIVAINI